MDFGNENLDGFAVFYENLTHAMLARGFEYHRALDRAYDNSQDYRAAILRAYEKDGFTLNVDLTEPEERIRFEFWSFFSRRSYDLNIKRLLEFVPIVIYNLDERFWYNSHCEEASSQILEALLKTQAVPNGTRTIGEILEDPPFPLKEPPEFCPRITSLQADQNIGRRIGGSTHAVKKPEVA